MAVSAALDKSILPIAEAALEAGFHVYALKNDARGPAGFVFVCLDSSGPFAAVNKPTHPWDRAEISAEIQPSREYGSGVQADYDGTPAGAVETLRRVCSSTTVTVRFVAKRGQAAPVVPNYGRKVLDKWPGGGAANFQEITLTAEEA